MILSTHINTTDTVNHVAIFHLHKIKEKSLLNDKPLILRSGHVHNCIHKESNINEVFQKKHLDAYAIARVIDWKKQL